MGKKVGYKGKVKKGSTTIAGMVSWTYSGSMRAMEDDSEFGNEHKTFLGMQIEGGDITTSGHFLLDEDAGQQLLKTAFIANSQWTDLRLYIDEDSGLYYTPDSTTTPASYVTISKFDDAGHSKAGIMSFSCTFKVSGVMVCNSDSSTPGVNTVGELDVAAATATLIGELTGLGGEASLDAYFEYGTTTSFGTDTSVSATTMSATGVFDNDLSGLTGSTTYYYRAVVEDGSTNKYYGETKSFTTAAP